MRVFHHYKKPPVKLSPRETQVREMVNQGMTSKAIAATLGISVHTVTNHRATIKDKERESYSYEVQSVR